MYIYFHITYFSIRLSNSKGNLKSIYFDDIVWAESMSQSFILPWGSIIGISSASYRRTLHIYDAMEQVGRHRSAPYARVLYCV